MRPPAVVAGLWTTTMRTVLPHRGAVANAREAVLHDRWAAAQRREAALVAARAAGHPSALLPGGTGAAPEGGRPLGGLALTLEERVRVADVAPLPGFAAAAETALDLLRGIADMDFWLVTAVQDDVERVVAARGAAGMPVPPGAVQPWAESYCRLMVAGEAPRAAPRACEVAAYAASPATARWGIGAYLGVPLLAADGSLFGVVCGLSAAERDDSLLDALPEVERVARLLSTVLAGESAVLESSQAAAQACALADKDPSTGLLNRRGWHARLQDEEERRRRCGSGASVLLVRVGTGGDAARRPVDGAGEPGDTDPVQDVARVLAVACRGADTLARLGERELAVLAVDCDAKRAARLVRRLRDALCDIGVPVALGVASGGRHEDLFEAWRQAEEQVQEQELRRATTAGAHDSPEL